MRAVTITYDDDQGKCPECNGTAEYQERWDKLFDDYDRNLSPMVAVVQKLYNEGEPKYICTNCNIKIMVRS
ncbi:hypothetical protein ACLBWT_12060 [Paenibacillus sp. D51F]